MSEPRIERRAALTYCAVRVEVTMGTLAESVAPVYEELERYLGSRGIEPTGPSLIRYREVSEDQPFTIEVGWVIEEGQWIEAPYVADVLPEGTYAVKTHQGPYADLAASTDHLLRWAAYEGLLFAVNTGEGLDDWGCWYELYLTDPTWGAHGPEGDVDVCLMLAESDANPHQ